MKTEPNAAGSSGTSCRDLCRTPDLRYEEARWSGGLGPVELRRFVPFEPCATSDRLGWVGLQAARYRNAPGSEIDLPPLACHALVFITRPPEQMELLHEGGDRHVPPPAGSVLVLPAGTSSRWRWRGFKDSLHVYLEPALVTRVADEEFGIDSAHFTVPPLEAVDAGYLQAALWAVDAELTAAGIAGRLVAESLANVLAVYLVRQILAPRQLRHAPDGVLPQSRLRAVIGYIEEHLNASPSLEEMAQIARLSPYHFARQFKRATGLPPHEYLIARRIERAKELLHQDQDHSLAEVAAEAGFSDQSQFSRHFKRLVGLTPRQFRNPARIA